MERVNDFLREALAGYQRAAALMDEPKIDWQQVFDALATSQLYLRQIAKESAQ